ncbi:MAG: formylglycine-generating enzyme family protein [Planctomycetes bacterium]|jgi:formylglycine-generating enzyme required for sulfatase activity|nr:formylglycine-generating enzyme family protein [Planctomycetota bacterium]
MRLFLVIVGVGVLLAGVGVIVWTALDLPPVQYVVAHGFPPAGGPTGREVEIEGVRFIEIGAGYFRMGSWFGLDRGDLLGWLCARFKLPWGKQPGPQGREAPVHWVRIARPYWLAATEVTNSQYARFDPEHERSECSPGDHHPVADVRWDDARRYCEWLSGRGPLAVRLPSESEWEYACRAGSTTEYCFGDDEAGLGECGWFGRPWGDSAREVGTRRANRWGLFDLHGNVWEWCGDRWHDDYEGAPGDGTAWTEGAASFRVDRGGGWDNPAVYCRSAGRGRRPPDARGISLGFRPAASPLSSRETGPSAGPANAEGGKIDPGSFFPPSDPISRSSGLWPPRGPRP